MSVSGTGTPTGGSARAEGPPSFVGQEACVARLLAGLGRVAARNCTVLIRGESGTGKELAARHLHARSPRAAGPFVAVDCTTLHDTLFESQLFGHVRGAFTGAERATLGMFRSADGGTLFFDEIAELDPRTQSKLLRCIEEGAVVPLGGIAPIPANVRIVAATHRDIDEMVHRGEFRQDLYYRLNVVCLDLAPLRARPGDIVLLSEHFLRLQAVTYREFPKTLSADAKAALIRYAWPGNVRELRNVIEHASAFAEGDRICAADLPEYVRGARENDRSNSRLGNRHREIVPLKVVERCMIERALRTTQGNQSRAARMLGVERHRLARLLRRHGISSRTRSLPGLEPLEAGSAAGFGAPGADRISIED